MAVIDDSSFPLIRLRISSQLSESEMEEAIAAAADVFARSQRVAFVIDLSQVKIAVNTQGRAHLAQVMATIQKEADRFMLGAVYVAPSIVSRGVIIALNWMRGKRPYPVSVVETEAEAEALARGWLQ